jgi:hypothetical protein
MKTLSIKKLTLTALICLAIMAANGQSFSKSETTSKNKKNQQLIAQLDAVYDNDQKYRLVLDSVVKKYGYDSKESEQIGQLMSKADSINTAYVIRFFEKYGWLSPDEIGLKGERTLCLVVQHSTMEVQKKYAPVMKKAVLAHKVEPAWYAILEDRIAVREGRKQVYGSQLHGNPNGAPWVSPLVDPDHVDERRASIGLEPMSEYLKQWNITWDLEKYKKELPQIEANEKGGWK